MSEGRDFNPAALGSSRSSERFAQMSAKRLIPVTWRWSAAKQGPLLICTDRSYQHRPSAAVTSDVSDADKTAIGLVPTWGSDRPNALNRSAIGALVLGVVLIWDLFRVL